MLNVVVDIRCVDCFSLIGDSDQFALIRVEVHLPVCFPSPVACLGHLVKTLRPRLS